MVEELFAQWWISLALIRQWIALVYVLNELLFILRREVPGNDFIGSSFAMLFGFRLGNKTWFIALNTLVLYIITLLLRLYLTLKSFIKVVLLTCLHDVRLGPPRRVHIGRLRTCDRVCRILQQDLFGMLFLCVQLQRLVDRSRLFAPLFNYCASHMLSAVLWKRTNLSIVK